MSTLTIVLLVILVIMIALLVALYFFGKKAQKRQQAQIDAASQRVSMLVIDKKRMPLKDAGLPQIVIDQTPKLMRRSKLPIVKAKVGAKIMTFVCDEKIFDMVPVKKEVKADISGIYITKVSGVRGPLEQQDPKKKKGFRQKLMEKASSLQKQAQEEENKTKNKK